MTKKEKIWLSHSDKNWNGGEPKEFERDHALRILKNQGHRNKKWTQVPNPETAKSDSKRGKDKAASSKTEK